MEDKNPLNSEKKHKKQDFLLPTAVELFDRTQLVKKLLIDQSWHQQETVTRDKLIDGLLFDSPGLCTKHESFI